MEDDSDFVIFSQQSCEFIFHGQNKQGYLASKILTRGEGKQWAMFILEYFWYI